MRTGVTLATCRKEYRSGVALTANVMFCVDVRLPGLFKLPASPIFYIKLNRAINPEVLL